LTRQVQIPYGEGSLSLEIPSDTMISVADLRIVNPTRPPDAEVRRALKNPVSLSLESLVKKDGKIVIVVNDITRPTPTSKILPPLLHELRSIGAHKDNIEIMVAPGMHRVNTEDEMRRIVGSEVFNEYQVVCHNPDEDKLAYLGRTSRGTKLIFNEKAVRADLRILTGNVEPHQLAGYTGGAKSLLPGLSCRESIEANHSLLLEPNVRVGSIRGNPIREDIEESLKVLGPTFLLNVVLNMRNEVVAASAGDAIKAHRRCVEICNRISEVNVPGKADIVIASPGGFPKDIDLYQAQKALTPAERAVRRGGVIILAAECRGGLGNELFREWMCEAKSPSDIIERMRREGFILGAHKAFLFARHMMNADLIIVSDIPSGILEEMHLTPASSIDEALEMAYKKVGRDAKITVLPHASSSIILN